MSRCSAGHGLQVYVGVCRSASLAPTACRSRSRESRRETTAIDALWSPSTTSNKTGSARGCCKTTLLDKGSSAGSPGSRFLRASATDDARETTGSSQSPAQDDDEEETDQLFSALPLNELRRPGEAGWGDDPVGPVGGEKFDNVFGKTQYDLNTTAIEVIGMGSWRLVGTVSPLIRVLVAHIEGAWRHLIDDLGLHHLPPEWKYIDSLDPDGDYGSWSFQDLEPPAKGEEGWPRLQIENRCYKSRAFRKLHMEVAHRQDGLEVLHCVMYPWVTFDLPILSMDLVAKDGIVSLAIIDPCPVSMDSSLPPAYVQTCSALQQEYGVENNRAMPDWGREIFSQQCIMMRPEDAEELLSFFRYAVALTRVHLRLAHNADPIQHNKASRMYQIEAAHKRYRQQMLQNSKTRRVLESSFSADFAAEYMAGLMFDTPPAGGEQGPGPGTQEGESKMAEESERVQSATGSPA